MGIVGIVVELLVVELLSEGICVGIYCRIGREVVRFVGDEGNF